MTVRPALHALVASLLALTVNPNGQYPADVMTDAVSVSRAACLPASADGAAACLPDRATPIGLPLTIRERTTARGAGPGALPDQGH